MQKYIPQVKGKQGFDFNFINHRQGLKPMYKDHKYKLITKDGSLLTNESRVLAQKYID